MSCRTSRRIAQCGRACAAGVVAGLLAFASSPADAACKYKRLGSIPYTWVGPRLVIDGSVNGTPLKMVVDTGASVTTVSSALAKRLDLPLTHVDNEVVGFGGRSQLSRSRLDEMSLGRFQWHGTKVGVAWDGPDLPDFLVSANALFERDVELDGHDIVFFTPGDCEDAELGYWADDVPWVPTEPPRADDLRVIIGVTVNGLPVRALVDSGATTSILDVSVARALGFDADDAVARVGTMTGIGKHVGAVTAMTLDTVAIGPEIVHRPRIEVADMWGSARQDYHSEAGSAYVAGQFRMVLGADFVASHRLLFANSQHRLYLSYVGGAVFRAPRPRAPTTAASRASEPEVQR